MSWKESQYNHAVVDFYNLLQWRAKTHPFLFSIGHLTHRGRMTHICVCKIDITAKRSYKPVNYLVVVCQTCAATGSHLLQVPLLFPWSLAPCHKWHDDVIKWKHFPRYWPFVRGIHRSPPVNTPHKGQWRGALMFSLICAWTNGWVNNREADDLRHHGANHDVIVILMLSTRVTSALWYQNANISS